MVFFDEMVFDAFVSSKTEQKSDGQLSAKSSLIFRMLLHFLFVSTTAKNVKVSLKNHSPLQSTGFQTPSVHSVQLLLLYTVSNNIKLVFWGKRKKIP